MNYVKKLLVFKMILTNWKNGQVNLRKEKCEVLPLGRNKQLWNATCQQSDRRFSGKDLRVMKV